MNRNYLYETVQRSPSTNFQQTIKLQRCNVTVVFVVAAFFPQVEIKIEGKMKKIHYLPISHLSPLKPSRHSQEKP